MADNLVFNPELYVKGTVNFRGEDIAYRFFSVDYVTAPAAPELQKMNIYVREDLADSHEAPILFIHRDGGVGEAAAWSLETEGEEHHVRWSFKGHVMVGALNAPKEPESVIARALKEGFVVASPGVRGRETVVGGVYVGRGDLPMTIIDLKAAVRYLKYNSGRVPGNTDRIISEGGSSGGGSSALLGASGNSPLYEKYLQELGAAPAGDDIYCALVDSPIHDFEHIDIAYEWQFGVDYVKGLFEEDQVSTAMSRAAAGKFAEYVDSLELKNPDTGAALSVKDGSYPDFMLEKLNESLNVYLSGMSTQEKQAWLSDEKNAGLARLEGDKAVIDSLAAYIGWNAGRWMKYVGCYDGFLDNASRENEAFGPVSGGVDHFSVSLAEAIKSVPEMAAAGTAWKEASLKNALAIKLLDTYSFLRGEEKSDIAPVWYVRCGGHHETTGAIFFNLCLLLEKLPDITLDWRFCWQQNHTSISLKEFDETMVFLGQMLS